VKDDINTVTLSGTLVSEVETSSSRDLIAARFLIAVTGAGEGTSAGTFNAVAFGEKAGEVEDLHQGDRVILLGALRRHAAAMDGHSVEIHLRTLIRMRPELLEHAARE
jgi:single-stranded DNA-binding protein